MKLERDYQAGLKKRIMQRFPGCFIKKNDPNEIQGWPDLTIYYRNTWACLEVKRYKDAPHQPNQDDWVDILNKMSFAAFIYPENEEEILDAMERTFEACWTSCSLRGE